MVRRRWPRFAAVPTHAARVLGVLVALGLVALGLAYFFRDELWPSRPDVVDDTRLACKECRHPRGAHPILMKLETGPSGRCVWLMHTEQERCRIRVANLGADSPIMAQWAIAPMSSPRPATPSSATSTGSPPSATT